MTSEAFSSELSGSDVIEVRDNASLAFAIAAGVILIVALSFAAAGWRGWFLLIGNTWFVVVIPLYVWRRFGRRPVLLLDKDGFRDRRLGFVLLPWSRLKSANASQNRIGALSGVVLKFDRLMTIFPPGITVSEVEIPLLGLDTDPLILLEHVRRFAAHATVETAQRGTLRSAACEWLEIIACGGNLCCSATETVFGRPR